MTVYGGFDMCLACENVSIGDQAQKVQNGVNILRNVIASMEGRISEFVYNPGRDFTRNSRLCLHNMVNILLSMSGKAIKSELGNYFNSKSSTPTPSAFNQQRKKIMPSFFETMYELYTDKLLDTNDGIVYYHDKWRIFTDDGMDITYPANSTELECYFPSENGGKAYNVLHVDAIQDILSGLYVAASMCGKREVDEQRSGAALMSRLSNVQNKIMLADRGYESYNYMAHCVENGFYFCIRGKDLESNGIISGLKLPNKSQFDIPVRMTLTNKNNEEVRELVRCKPNEFKHIDGKKFDFLPDRSNKSDPMETYTIFFRIVRIKLPNGDYEILLTNLDSTEFPPSELKILYNLRWGIETSFRRLKYSIDVNKVHSKISDNIMQEVFCGMIVFNLTQYVIHNIEIKQNKKYPYQINFDTAVQSCRKLYFWKNTSSDTVLLLRRSTEPIRHNRSYPRKKRQSTNYGFGYRGAGSP